MKCDDVRPRVSVAVVSYKHEAFIVQAIRSAATQETDFPFEIVVGDDCSPDATGERLRELAEEFPRTVRLLERPTNMGAALNFVDVLSQCRGEFIALLEGDDYWSAKDKLQRQADLLEAEQSCSACFHKVSVLDSSQGRIVRVLRPPVAREGYTADDLLEFGEFVPTPATMFRADFVSRLPAWYSELKVGDFPLHVLLALEGDLGFIDDSMAVYREHIGGAYSSLDEREQLQGKIAIYRALDSHLGLSKRASYRKGLSENYFRLCWIHRSRRERRQALLAGWRAIKHVPRGEKLAMFGKFVSHARKRASDKLRPRAVSSS